MLIDPKQIYKCEYEFPSGYTIDIEHNFLNDVPFGNKLNFTDFNIEETFDIIEHLRKLRFSHELCMKYYDESVLHLPLDYLKPVNHNPYIEHFEEWINRGMKPRDNETTLTRKLFPYLEKYRLTSLKKNFFSFSPEEFPGDFYIEKSNIHSQSESSSERQYKLLKEIKDLSAEETFIREYYPEFIYGREIIEISEIVDNSANKWGPSGILYSSYRRCSEDEKKNWWSYNSKPKFLNENFGKEKEFIDEISKGPYSILNKNGKKVKLFHDGPKFLSGKEAREIYNPHKENLRVFSFCNYFNSRNCPEAKISIDFPGEFIKEFTKHIVERPLNLNLDNFEKTYNVVLNNPEFFWDSLKLSKRMFQYSLETENRELEDSLDRLERYRIESDEKRQMYFEEMGSLEEIVRITWEIPNKNPIKQRESGDVHHIGELLESVVWK